MKPKGPISIDALKFNMMGDLRGEFGGTIREPERPRSAVEQLEAERDAARLEARRLRYQLDLANADVATLRRAHAQLERALEVARSTSGSLDQEFVGELIRLCHPDRHAAVFGVLANKVTARLLAMRR